MSNPRCANGSRRRRNRARLIAEGRPCWICQAFGRPAAIDYRLPARHPLSFEVDELVPVSRYWEGGYPSARLCAEDYSNLAATHRACNEWRSNKSVGEVLRAAAQARGAARTSREGLPQPWGR